MMWGTGLPVVTGETVDTVLAAASDTITPVLTNTDPLRIAL